MSEDWSERPEAGGRLAIWLIRAIALHLGRGFARALLYPITLYFFLRRGPERRASRAFLARAFGRPASSWQVMRHIHSYAATLLDRIFLLSGAYRRYDVRVHGLDMLHAQIDRGRGVLLLGAHIGSFEVLRALGETRPDVRICVVMDRQQTPALTELMHALNPAIAANVIDAGADPAEMALRMHAAAHDGALLGLLADRARPGEAVHDAEFFGARAPFPVGPYLVASLLELPVVLAFGLYRGGHRYDLHFELFAEELRLARGARNAQLGEWAQRFAARLEHYTRIDPYNWFNIYDFWNARAAGAHRDGEPARGLHADA
jgi:predicted LPLAT superfamily acyltransferase